jgi:hypothetical protein
VASSSRGWMHEVRESGVATRRMCAPPSLLSGAATLALGGALVADATHGAHHPTHSIVLGLVALVVASLRRLGRRAMATVPAISAALAVQPVLHLMSEAVGPDVAATDHQDLVHHLLVSEMPTAGVQIAVPALAVTAMVVVAHLLHLLLDAVRRPLAALAAPHTPPLMFVPVRARRLGSMLRWCGWVLQAARRGPPAVAAYGIL